MKQTPARWCKTRTRGCAESDTIRTVRPGAVPVCSPRTPTSAPSLGGGTAKGQLWKESGSHVVRRGGGEGAGKGRRGGAEELHREERSVGVLPSAVFNFGCLSTIEKKPESTREVGNTDSRQTAAGLLRGRAGGWRGGEEADRERRSCRRKGPSAFIFAVVLVLM